MYDSEELKVLCGNTFPLPEYDYDDEMVEGDTNTPVVDHGLREYYFVNITQYMATPEFKENYNSVIPHIKSHSTKKQQELAFAIVQKLPEKYGFEFSITYDPFYSQNEVDELYNFIEFVEFKHEKFITNIWKFLKPDLNPFRLEIFCEQNSPKILREIEEELETTHYSELITDFLRTYDKEKLIEWFCEKSKALYVSILLALREE
jgi:hypothetical protein